MPCVTKKTESGLMFFCGRGLKKAERCHRCGDFAEFLCDYPVGSGRTCDLSMCPEHRHHVGEERDFCAVHHSRWAKEKTLNEVWDPELKIVKSGDVNASPSAHRIIIANRKTHSGPGVYIGRRMRNLSGSPLGNPYRLAPGGDRNACIELYKRWLWREIKSGGAALDELRRLIEISRTQDVTLLCWCEPLRCHGDVVRDAMVWGRNAL